MITLITGLPGNGKTLYALAWLREKAAKEGRQVYYNGIPDLRVPGWIELVEAEKWDQLPKGSILIIDEAQRIFRPRMHGKEVPAYVAALETHRHLGVDLVFITQHPMLIESNVRRLCGQHFHVIRKFGTHFATIHEWGATKETCDKNRDDSVRHEWKFPKEVFALYKSAEVHTHKRRIPLKVILLLCMPLVLGALAWYAWYRLDPARAKEKADLQKLAAPAGGASAPGGTFGAPGQLTVAQYLEMHQPRVAGLVHTAPVFDQVTMPTVAPFPAACVSMGARCDCYSQQATRLDVGRDLCLQIVERGYFVSWREEPGRAPFDKRNSDGQASPANSAKDDGTAKAAPGYSVAGDLRDARRTVRGGGAFHSAPAAPPPARSPGGGAAAGGA